MQSIISNLGSAKRARLHGRPHLCAPTTLIVPGILAGSNGPIYYSKEAIAESVQNWNHVPVTNGHPPGGFRGDATTLDEYGLGVVLNAKIRRTDGALQGEIWLDIRKCKALAPEVINRLERGIAVEVSTGLKLTQVKRTGYHKNQAYDRVAKDFQPDHLALLDQEGACSLRDGCGVLMNCSGKSGCGCKNCEQAEFEKNFKSLVERQRRKMYGDPRFISDDDMDYPAYRGEPLGVPELISNYRGRVDNRLSGPLSVPDMFENLATAPESEFGTVGGDDYEPDEPAEEDDDPEAGKKASHSRVFLKALYQRNPNWRRPKDVDIDHGDAEPEPMDFGPTSFADDPPEDDGEGTGGEPLPIPTLDWKAVQAEQRRKDRELQRK